MMLTWVSESLTATKSGLLAGLNLFLASGKEPDTADSPQTSPFPLPDLRLNQQHLLASGQPRDMTRPAASAEQTCLATVGGYTLEMPGGISLVRLFRRNLQMLKRVSGMWELNGSSCVCGRVGVELEEKVKGLEVVENVGYRCASP